jgi:hypothetical protein
MIPIKTWSKNELKIIYAVIALGGPFIWLASYLVMPKFGPPSDGCGVNNPYGKSVIKQLRRKTPEEYV